jgi:phosphoribosyl-ATP pyrophosphohydrolase
MIIPKITLVPTVDPSDLVDQLKHWGLFGSVAISEIESGSIASLESVIKIVGGMMDLILELTEPNNDDALTLLNAGASLILCSPTDIPQLDAVPVDRLVQWKNDDSSDQAIPPGVLINALQPTAARIAELEMARIDTLIDVAQLDEHPELIADFFQTVLVTDRPDGLWSTVIVDSLGIALGLAYSNYESLLYAIEHRCGTYWSRSRDGLWIKGETSGATQQLLGLRLDCDRDCLRFTVTQDPPGFCHRNTHACFGQERTIQSVMQRLNERISDVDEKSFTRKLANDARMLETKLLEEAKELSEASQTDDQNEIAWEAADVFYFSLVAMLKNGVTLDRVYDELARRMNRVVRRGPGIKANGN